MHVVFSSVSGSPGTTSWAMLSAAAWPADYGVERVVLEAARDGGVLGARYQLGVEPGVSTLAAVVRRHVPGDPLPVAEFARQVGPGLWVVPQPESAEAAATIWSSVSAVASAIAGDPRVWVVDAGRLGPGGFGMAFAAQSSLAVVVSGVGEESLVQLPARVQSLQRAGALVAVLVVGKLRHSVQELGAFAGTGLVWSVAAERDLPAWVAAVLSGGRARRGWVWRQAVEVAAEIAERVMATSSPADVEAEG